MLRNELNENIDLPEILFMNLTLRHMEDDKKDFRKISIPEELEFGGRKYSLNGVAFHHGPGAGYGHYTCLVRTWSHLDDDWFHINDDKCHRVVDKKKMLDTVTKGQGKNFTSYLVAYHRES